MSDVRYKIVFSGQLMPNFELATVENNLAQLFKSDIDKIRQLFSGNPVAIKRDLDDAQADKYIAALQRAGAHVSKESDLSASLSLVATDDHPEETPAATQDSPAMQAQASDRMTCPKCDFEQPKSAECAGCGIIIDKFLARQAEFAASVQTVDSSSSPASPYATPQAAVYEDMGEVGELKPLSLSGRIGRLRYLAWSLVMMFAAIPLAAIGGGLIASDTIAPLGWLIMIAAFIGILVYGVTIGVQRLHDIGWSGWLYLLNLVPVVNWVFPIVVLVMPGTQGANRFGPPPPPNSGAVKVLAALWIGMLLIIPILAAVSIPAYQDYVSRAEQAQMGDDGGYDEEAFLEFQRQLEEQQQ
ncbi:DUF805 domain-containing protein [Atopomonas sediminilitoris]|uniref:DUF805 domain-containing protein n=1 Tax=Atopomonas sediminilitoris TaxID=2919919 RepID=UPI001F4E3491|nr:DUF805 domain-containing protein [Atopomonas sediminilitoris]MCJ8168535.1 DUF805 domain-containing protein [Atopomonas sediminilitoris]